MRVPLMPIVTGERYPRKREKDGGIKNQGKNRDH